MFTQLFQIRIMQFPKEEFKKENPQTNPSLLQQTTQINTVKPKLA